MPTSLRERDRNAVETAQGHPAYGSVRRLGSGIGLATILVLDFLALDDITTAGAWIEGVGPGFVPPLWSDEIADELVSVSTEEAMAMTRRLAREEALWG